MIKEAFLNRNVSIVM